MNPSTSIWPRRSGLVLRASFALAAVLAANVTSGVAQLSVQEIASNSTSSVFQVVTELGDGSCFLVDPIRGLVVTNAHVTSGQDTVGVKLDPWQKVAGAVVLEDSRNDVAVIRINPAVV